MQLKLRIETPEQKGGSWKIVEMVLAERNCTATTCLKAAPHRKFYHSLSVAGPAFFREQRKMSFYKNF